MQEQQQKTREFYQKLQEESLQKIMNVLTPQQRQQLEQLMGQKFEYRR